jgi:ABC-2 type transport system ATP-binding protein
MVEERARRGEWRSAAHRRRHAEVLQRLDQVEHRLRRLDAQVEDVRLITESLRAPSAVRARNGKAAVNGQAAVTGQVHAAEVAQPAEVAPVEPDPLAAPEPRPPGKRLLRVEGLAKEIAGTDILTDITFDVVEGEILGLIGPNGAGKTTMMECLAGMRPRSGGIFAVGDAEAPPTWTPKELMFYLPNNVMPYAELYTIEVLTFFGQLYEVEQSRWERIVIHDLSLAPAHYKRVGALSKGNKQRLLIAQALISPQPLLALDEPFDGLDLHQTQAMMGILRGLRAQERTLLLCIHQLNDAERICDRFLLLSAGRLVGVGTLAELRAQTGLVRGRLEEIFLALTS